MATLILFLLLLGVILLLIWFNLNYQKKVKGLHENVLKLEHLLEDERSRGSRNGVLEKYIKLEAKVKELNASAQIIGSADNVEEQINQLEHFFASHFKTMPPYVSKLCKRLRRMVSADERIMQLHSQVMRPLQGMLYTQEVTDDIYVQRMVLARMIDALWIAFDAVETIADGDNIRPEQQLAIDFLCGKSSRLEILNAARIVTTDPEQTPKWVRVIRRAVLPLRLDEQYPVLYSGYKLEQLDEYVASDEEIKKIQQEDELKLETDNLLKNVEPTEKTTILSEEEDTKEKGHENV